MVDMIFTVAVPHASLAVGGVNDGVAGQSIVAFAPAAVIVGGVISVTVIVCTWSAAAFPQLSTRCHVRAITLLPWQGPLVTTSVYVAFKPVEQLSASLVTSPVAATLAS